MESDTLVTKFNSYLPMFLDEFEGKLRSEMLSRKQDPEFFWKQVRNDVLNKYWTLAKCYTAHGEAVDRRIPSPRQTLDQQLGKRLAGCMTAKVRELSEEYSSFCVWDDSPKTVEVHKKATPNNQDSRRFLRVGAIEDAPKRESKSSFSSGLAEELAKVKKGQYICFEYDNSDNAHSDQQLLPGAVRRAGWYKGLNGKERPYKSRLIVRNDLFCLYVYRLEDPVRSKHS